MPSRRQSKSILKLRLAIARPAAKNGGSILRLETVCVEADSDFPRADAHHITYRAPRCAGIGLRGRAAAGALVREPYLAVRRIAWGPYCGRPTWPKSEYN